MISDAERFAEIDAHVAKPARVSDKRTNIGKRRYVRPIGTGFKALAACGCSASIALGGVCTACGGAHEHVR